MATPAPGIPASCFTVSNLTAAGILPPEIIFTPGKSKQSKCYLFCPAALHSGHTASRVIRAAISLHGCLGDCCLNKEHSFLLLQQKKWEVEEENGAKVAQLHQLHQCSEH